MPKISDQRLAARREGILKAALRCLERNGLEGTGMRDVFRAANLSPGAVYRYFGSKEELLAAAAAQAPEPIAVAVADGAGDPGSEDGLAALLAAAVAAPGNRLRLELLTAAQASRSVAAALRERHAAARRQLEQRLAPAAGPESEALAELILALATGLAARQLLEPGLDPAPLCAAAARLAVGHLTG